MARPFDPALLAASVRDLAADAHRAFNNPATTADEAEILSHRIRRLERQIGNRPFRDLTHWLENLRRELEDRTRTQPRSKYHP